MRVRLSLLNPFTESKFLISLPEEVQTISQLKKHLYSSLSSISNVVGSSKDIKLEMDGFELLAGSGVDVLQEGDVVQVSARSGSSTSSYLRASSKRRSTSLDTRGMAKRQRRTPSTQVNGVSGNVETLPTRKVKTASSSSSSSSSELSSSSLSSSSSTSSSTSSSSSSSPAPSLERQPKRVATNAAHPPTESSTNPFPVLVNGPLIDQDVPPGQGKAETRNRNARRRKSRQYRRAEAEAEGSAMSPINGGKALTPLGDQSNGVGEVLGSINGPSMEAVRSLPNANRNKRKGFFKDMVNQKGVKTTFSDTEGHLQEEALPNGHIDIASAIPAPSEFASKRSSLGPRHSRPPSELPDLPNNVFVTSVDFGKPGSSIARTVPSKSAVTPIEHDTEKISDPNEMSLDQYFDSPLNDTQEYAPDNIVRIVGQVEKAFHASAFPYITADTMLEDFRDKYLIWQDVFLTNWTPKSMLVFAKVIKVDSTTGSITVRQVSIDRDGDFIELGYVEEAVLEKERLLVEPGDLRSEYRIIGDIISYLTNPDA